VPSTFDVLDLLERHGVFDEFQMPNPPWPEVDYGNEDVHLIDWRRLFPQDRPNYYGDEWDDGLLPPPSSASGAFSGGTFAPGGAWDVLAWYQPIHLYGPDWGIFIREDGITTVAARISKIAGGTLSWRECIRAAIATLFLHEAYHHKIESFATRVLAAREQPVYPHYFSNVYRALINTDDLREEALANAESWRRIIERAYAISDVDAVRSYLERDFSSSPPGYRRAVDFLAYEEFRLGQAELLNQVAAASVTTSQAPADWLAVTRMHQSLFDVRQNFWTVVPKGTLPGLPIVTLPKYETTGLVKALRAAGWQEVRGAKHRRFTDATGRKVHLCRRREQPPHVAGQVADALGISVTELV
jgi:hypothetical protein